MRALVPALLLLLPLSLQPAPAATIIPIARFEQGDLSGWEEEVFSNQTRYQIITQNGHQALAAASRASASGLVKKIRVDLEQTPYLNWRWRIEHPLPPLNERSKAGDDYAARVYVIASGGVFFWKTRALNYVWSSSQAIGSHWPNAYTSQVRMLAVRSGSQDTGRWITEKRNVYQDLRRIFGEHIRYIDAVAIMTDSDNSGLSSHAYYGNIFFSSH